MPLLSRRAQAASLALTHGDASLRRPEDDVACEAAEQRAWALCAALPAASGVRALLARSELLPHIKVSACRGWTRFGGHGCQTGAVRALLARPELLPHIKVSGCTSWFGMV